MKYEFSSTYTLVQDGKNFTCEDKIKINRFSNKTEKLVFEFDGSIPSYLNLFVVLINPQTGEQVYESILHDEKTGEYYYIIGTGISFYPGVWSLTVIGVEQDYEISETSTIDETLIFYVSNPFKKLVVLKQDIEDDAVQLSYPSLEKNILDFHIIHDNVVQIAMNCADIEVECHKILDENKQVKAETEEIHEQCEEILTQCESTLVNCRSILTQVTQQQTALNSLYSNLSAQLREQYENHMSALEARYQQYIREIEERG